MLNLSLTTPNTNLIGINSLTSTTSAHYNNFGVSMKQKFTQLCAHPPELMMVCSCLSNGVQIMDSGDAHELSRLQFAVAHAQLNSYCAHARLIWNAQPFSCLISSLSPFIKSYRSSSLLGKNHEIWILLLVFFFFCSVLSSHEASPPFSRSIPSSNSNVFSFHTFQRANLYEL